MVILDLFCGAGGAAMGYNRAGFDVVGVDLVEQPDYPFEFYRMDALYALWCELVNTGGHASRSRFSLVHASPPCQHASSLKALHPGRQYPALIDPVRDLLRRTGLPYVIENVVGAALVEPVKVCGSAFGLRVRRHRLFECSLPIEGTTCDHKGQGEIVGVYGASDGQRRCFKPDTRNPSWKRGPRQVTTAEAREVMEMPWVSTRRGLTEAIPPAYTEFIGRQLRDRLPV